MDASLLLQYVVIALAVGLSAWVVAKRQFPGSVRKLRVVVALALLRPARPAWVQALGRWVSPVIAKPASDGCGGCDNCGPTPRL